jgi:dienelactone hydrolase
MSNSKRMANFLFRFVCGLCILFFCSHLSNGHRTERGVSGLDSLPSVFSGEPADLIYKKLRLEAATAYQLRQLPSSPAEWPKFRAELRKKVIEKAGVQFFHSLPVNYRETGEIRRNGYSIKNVLFQTRPGVYATANLYVPSGKGLFPAVLTMHGHWPNGKANAIFQSIGHSLALNGYVCLVVDIWGSGERTSVHGVDEYHGSNLGASVLNLGESLLGVQLSDNMRGIDLLCSLPYVDAGRIGATGASGGGNQTMWLAAVDERVKAAMPVVSVGTFDSYIMEDNCVCEVLPDGLTFTEEAGILALTAPRALQICNVTKEINPTFVPVEMLRSYKRLAPVYKMLGATDQVNYRLFNDEHTYSADMRGHLLGWLDLHLKGLGNGGKQKEILFELIEEQQLMVFPTGKREPAVENIRTYCERRGKQLMAENESEKKQSVVKTDQLKQILRLDEPLTVEKLHRLGQKDGWERLAFETEDERLIPVLFKAPAIGVSEYAILVNPKGKQYMDLSLVKSYLQQGKGVMIADLWGTGEAASAYADVYDKSLVQFHTLARAKQWLGRSVLGEWCAELGLLTDYIHSLNKAARISIDGTREAGLAGLLYSATHTGVESITLRQSPVSYVFDNQGNVDFFSMATQLIGFLKWGDLSVAAALSEASITFINPLTISGREPKPEELEAYRLNYEKEKKKYGKSGKTNFK